MVMTGWADEGMAFLGLLVWVGWIHTYLSSMVGFWLLGLAGWLSVWMEGWGSDYCDEWNG